MDQNTLHFAHGAFSAGYFIAAVFFLKFWSRTRQPLLLMFSCAFMLLGVSHCIVGLLDLPPEERSQVYLLRLGAFVLIIAGIIRVNLGNDPLRRR